MNLTALDDLQTQINSLRTVGSHTPILPQDHNDIKTALQMICDLLSPVRNTSALQSQINVLRNVNIGDYVLADDLDNLELALKTTSGIIGQMTNVTPLNALLDYLRTVQTGAYVLPNDHNSITPPLQMIHDLLATMDLGNLLNPYAHIVIQQTFTGPLTAFDSTEIIRQDIGDIQSYFGPPTIGRPWVPLKIVSPLFVSGYMTPLDAPNPDTEYTVLQLRVNLRVGSFQRINLGMCTQLELPNQFPNEVYINSILNAPYIGEWGITDELTYFEIVATAYLQNIPLMIPINFYVHDVYVQGVISLGA